MKKTKYTVYVFYIPESQKVDVRFHDGCQKSFSIEDRLLMAARCSERDYIENKILDYYEEINDPQNSIDIVFC